MRKSIKRFYYSNTLPLTF